MDFVPAFFRVRWARRGLWGLCVVVGLALATGGGGRAAHAQWEDLQLRPLAPGPQARAGVYLLRTGRPHAARPFLRRAGAARPGLTLPEHGAVAYWLGRAYAQTGDSARARAAWRRGVATMLNGDAGVDVRLADAYLRTLTPARLRGERPRAVAAYTQLLARVTPDTIAAVTAVFRRRVAQLAPLLPDDIFERVVDGPRDAPDDWALRPEAGRALQAWWRGWDPYPSTPENERLEEHLTRLARAQRSFACAHRPAGLDRRGLVYLRFGAPARRHELSYTDGRFYREVVRFGVEIPPDAFPASELWTYPQIDDAGYYLFAEDARDCFALTRTTDLLPRTLTRQRSTTERGLNHAYSGLMALRALYDQLSLYHGAFAGRFATLSNYADYQERAAVRAEMKEQTALSLPDGGETHRTVGAGATARTVTTNPTLGVEAPSRVAARLVTEARRADAAAARRRTERMPRQYSALNAGVPRLPVAVRTARFLTPDGTTRTELYWGLRPEAAALPADSGTAPSLVRVAATQRGAAHPQVRRVVRRHRLAPDAARGASLVTSRLAFEGTAAPQRLSIRWAQYALRPSDGGPETAGPLRRHALVRIDSIAPLRAAGDRLELSDLTVRTLPDSVSASAADLAAPSVPYPFRRLPPDRPLLLSFEAYHLATDADGRTRYTIAYEVQGRQRRGWTRLFRDAKTQRTGTETTVRGRDRRTADLLLLDLSGLRADAPMDLRVTVTVTDERTGASVRRAVDLALEAPSP